MTIFKLFEKTNEMAAGTFKIIPVLCYSAIANLLFFNCRCFVADDVGRMQWCMFDDWSDVNIN